MELVRASGVISLPKSQLEAQTEQKSERGQSKSRSTSSSLFEQLQLTPHSLNRFGASWESSSNTSNSAGYNSSTTCSLPPSLGPHHFFPPPDPSQHSTTPHGELPDGEQTRRIR